MNSMISKIKNSEFLSFAELLKLKVSVVLFFLFIFGALTVPVSFFEDFSLEIKIFAPLAFIFSFLISLILLTANKVRISMHFSIYTFIGLTVYYIVGSNHLYGFLVIFITLTIIIFYQDIYTYILYGGALTTYGVVYIQFYGSELIGDNIETLGLSGYVYIGVLVGFFVIYLIHFILFDSIDEKLNKEYLKIQKITKRYRGQCLKYMESIEDRKNEDALYDKKQFQDSVRDLSVFLNAFLEETDDEISEVIEFYFFLHSQSTEHILSSKSLNPTIQRFTKELDKYLTHRNSELNEIVFNFVSQFKEAFKTYDKYRYEYHIHKLFSSRSNKLIALALIYQYLRSEITQYDKWGRVERSLSHQEIVNLFKTPVFRDIISYQDMTFFLANQTLFEKYLG